LNTVDRYPALTAISSSSGASSHALTRFSISTGSIDLPPDFAPLLYLGEAGDSSAYFDQHVGFLPPYGLPDDLFPPDGYFRQGCRLFLPPVRPTAVIERDNWRNLRSMIRLEQWPPQFRQFADRVAGIVDDRCKGFCLWDRSIKGSYSFKIPRESGKVVAKLALSDDRPPRLLAGFSAVIPGAEDLVRQVSPEVMRRRFQGEPFYMSPADTEGEPEVVADLFVEFLVEARNAFD